MYHISWLRATAKWGIYKESHLDWVKGNAIRENSRDTLRSRKLLDKTHHLTYHRPEILGRISQVQHETLRKGINHEPL
jgi:hypothetical protein